MRKIETGRAGSQIYLTMNNCLMRPRAHIKIWNMQEFWRTEIDERVSGDVAGTSTVLCVTNTAQHTLD